jgi:CRP-like cAMP-binding protein
VSLIIQRKLALLGPLSDEEKRAVETAAGRVRRVGPHENLVREGTRPTECNLILEGFACRYKILSKGTRQILSFQIAGDFCDIQSYVLQRLDHSIGTLTPCKVALFPHPLIKELTERYPAIGRALWRETLIDAAIYREWMASIGRRSAYQRIAHVLCELSTRLRAVGLARDDGSFRVPITQAELGDALGLSTVHVNRVLRRLRLEQLITFSAGTLIIHDTEGLAAAGDFDPVYLQITEQRAH